jgi:P4 family phage/plasmid primase-like protien
MNILYKTKKECLKANEKEKGLIMSYQINKYMIVRNYEEFLEFIKKNPTCFEYISSSIPVKLFFDIEIFKKDKVLYESPESVVEVIENIYGNQYILLESHKEGIKKSFHIIYPDIHFRNVIVLKKEVLGKKQLKTLLEKKIIDSSVYREGVFRTLYSSKQNEKRPLIYSKYSPIKDSDLDTFVTNIIGYYNFFSDLPTSKADSEVDSEACLVIQEYQESQELLGGTVVTLSELDKKAIKIFIRKTYNYKANDIKDILLKNDAIIVALTDRLCDNVDREHKSNHQYIILDEIGSRQKCHDQDCIRYKKGEKKFNDLPENIQLLINRFATRSNDNLNAATNECKEYIKKFDESIDTVEYDKSLMLFKGNATESNSIKIDGKCQNCQVEHQIGENGYCAKCRVCSAVFPKNDVLELVGNKYKNLNNFWQFNLNGNIIINNNYQGEDNFICDISIDSSIFKNTETTDLINQILDGHKISKVGQLLKLQYDNFVFEDEIWYFFNGILWEKDASTIQLKKVILESTSMFNKIQTFYAAKTNSIENDKIINNVKNLITKINKPGFKKEIVDDAKLFFYEKRFVSKLNSKKHLVPFNNGAYDLLKNEFRLTKKQDYISLTVNYNYDNSVNNPEVWTFIEQVLPNVKIRDYVLKKMSECLNGDIPNTNFLMFIGDGANGKSQLLNLMKLVMGELGEKVEVTLLTRKRNNANETNSEKMKLMNKRFAFLSEPEDGEKINVGLLKELTGSEEIVARGLYQDSISFVMETKLFLACNELPDIKGEDTAIWRRIRVVNFPSRFVDEPAESNEFPIDRTLPSRMREDVTWRQTFMNILLSYYYKVVPEPDEVKFRTDAYRNDSNEIELWLKDNIEFKENAILDLKVLCERYFNGKFNVSTKEKSKLKKETEIFIKKNFSNIESECKSTTINSNKLRCWISIQLTDH